MEYCDVRFTGGLTCGIEWMTTKVVVTNGIASKEYIAHIKNS